MRSTAQMEGFLLRQKVGHSIVTGRKEERVGVNTSKFMDLVIAIKGALI